MEEILWEKGILGDQNPEQLLQTLHHFIELNRSVPAAVHKDLKDGVRME